jgi:xanthine dehydrogenase small subunit
MTHPPVHVIRRGEIVSLGNVPPTRTLLQVLREDLHCTGTKEGCNEGDCGACTVVLGEAQGEHVKYSAVNSCIRLAQSVDGLAIWTAEDLALANGDLHPIQQALVDQHASQCGFCTPGFAMSLFGLYQNQVVKGQAVSRSQAQEALSGNLCRCTGYRAILDAAQHMAQLPLAPVDEHELLQKLEHLCQQTRGLELNSSYIIPHNLTDLLTARAARPQAQVVAGCTDVGLWINKLHRQFDQVLDLSRVAELRQVVDTPQHLAIGAAVTLSDAFAALVQARPALQSFASRFAGLPVRNAGTLGGNVANGSPIGDAMPLLIALDATVVLMCQRDGQAHSRELPLAQFYTGYRQNVLAADEVLAWIRVPQARPGEFCRVYKVSKRLEDDISAVCLAIKLQLQDGQVLHASVGVGGVAATPARAVQTEAALRGQPWTTATVQRAASTLQAEFNPISDMRASAGYRVRVLGNLLTRFWLETQGQQAISLASLAPQGASA